MSCLAFRSKIFFETANLWKFLNSYWKIFTSSCKICFSFLLWLFSAFLSKFLVLSLRFRGFFVLPQNQDHYSSSEVVTKISLKLWMRSNQGFSFLTFLNFFLGTNLLVFPDVLFTFCTLYIFYRHTLLHFAFLVYF